MAIARLAFILGFASLVLAQYGPGGRYGPPGDDNDDGPRGGERGPPGRGRFDRDQVAIAHGVLASLAFVAFFPIGSILVRLGSFRGLWLVHGLFQTFAFVVYIAAFGLGIWMTQQAPPRLDLISGYHPIIGIVLFVALFFQPVLGVVHHIQFKKFETRTIWSHAHLWLGRLVITLGMINGGLGLLFATQTGYQPPTRAQIIVYGVFAGVMWLLWVAASIFGERKRRVARRYPMNVYKEEYA